MTRFIVSAVIVQLSVFVSQWAGAHELDASTVFDRCLDSHEGRGDESPHEVESAIAACEAEADAYAAMLDVDAYNLALRDVGAAPEFCAVTFAEPDATHGWRAVCVLDTDSATPAPVPFRVAGAQ